LSAVAPRRGAKVEVPIPGPKPRLRGLLAKIRDRLKAAGIDNPVSEAEMIISEALSIPRAQIYLEPGRKLNQRQLIKINRWAKERARRRPLAHIIEKTWFREIELKITPAALVPRQETELLVEEAIKIIAGEPAIKKILDLGTGSGAIILSLAYELKDLPRKLQFYGSDISPSALALARKNARLLGFKNQIIFRGGDLLTPFKDEKFNLIICNPPYIPTKDLKKLMPEVSRYEPRIALNGGSQGLQIIEKILALAPSHLLPNGWLLFEISIRQAPLLRKLPSPLKLQKLIKDYSAIDRIAAFQLLP